MLVEMRCHSEPCGRNCFERLVSDSIPFPAPGEAFSQEVRNHWLAKTQKVWPCVNTGSCRIEVAHSNTADVYASIAVEEFGAAGLPAQQWLLAILRDPEPEQTPEPVRRALQHPSGAEVIRYLQKSIQRLHTSPGYVLN